MRGEGHDMFVYTNACRHSSEITRKTYNKPRRVSKRMRLKIKSKYCHVFLVSMTNNSGFLIR
jgi:hypothetical protein